MTQQRPRQSSILPQLMLCVASAGFFPFCACRRGDNAAATVVVYCSVDEAFARVIFDEFERRAGVMVETIYDTEAGKTTGLISRIRAERGQPRSDVLFSGELFNTIRLGEEGLLAAYDPPSAGDIPESFRDRARRWTAIGLRGRVLAYDPKRVSVEALPKTWSELSEPRWASRLAMANPLFGTTRGHVGAMFALWGKEAGTRFLRDLKAGGALVVDGNSTAVRAVLDGRADVCMTDTDDVWGARRDGGSIDLVYPDMGNGGTLWIPSSVAMLAGARHPEAARRLVDFLVSADCERMLASSSSQNVPVRASLRRSLEMTGYEMPAVDYDAIAAAMDDAAEVAGEALLK